MPIESGGTQGIDTAAIRAQLAAEEAKKAEAAKTIQVEAAPADAQPVDQLAQFREKRAAQEQTAKAPEAKTEILSADEKYELMRSVDEIKPMVGEMRATFDQQRDAALAEANQMAAKADQIRKHSTDINELMSLDQLEVTERDKRDSVETLMRLSENLREIDDMAALGSLPPREARAQILKIINSLHGSERYFQGKSRHLTEHPTSISPSEIQLLEEKRTKVSSLLNRLRSARDKYADHITAGQAAQQKVAA